MSQAHKGSRLLVKDAIYAIPFESAHFNFDRDVNGIQYGDLVKPVVDPVVTMVDGKFGGGAAIEESTTNLYTNQSYFTQAGVNATFDSVSGEWTVVLPSTNTGSWRGIYYNQTNALFSAGQKGALSFEVYSDESGIPIDVDINNDPATTPTGSNDNDIVANRVFRTAATAANQWVKMDVYFEFSTGNTQQFYDYSKIVFGNGYAPGQNKTIKIRKIQLEKKAFKTSFVNGTRGGGSISYPASMLNKNEGAISLWLYNPSRLPVNTSYRRIVSFIGAVNAYGDTDVHFDIYQNKPRFRFAANGSNFNIGTTSDLIQDGWNHMVISWGPDGFKQYANGKMATNSNYTSGFSSLNDKILIGKNYDSSNSYLNGIIDELRIDKTQPSDDEVLSWYYSQAPFYNPYDLRAYAY